MSVFVLQGVTKVFTVNKQDHVVLDHINLTFPDKGLVSIVGKSGSGKSTLLNILMGIEKPSEGKVFFKGKNVARLNDKKFSAFHLSGISTIFQHYNLFDDLTAMENVLLPIRMKGGNIRKWKKKIKAEFERLNIGYVIRQKVRKLSGGEKQRVAILRSIIASPEVILCDEPTGALDEQNSREIMGILKDLSVNRLIIMVSHNLELVNEFSDYTITLKDGKIENSNLPVGEIEEHKRKRKRCSYKSGWINKFLNKNLKSNLFKNMFSIISCTIGFASVFLCVGFLIGSERSHEEAITKNLCIGNASVQKIEAIEITDSPLTYQKTVRPDLEEVDKEFEDFESLRIEENLSYFISSCANCEFRGESFTNFQMVPLYDLSLSNYGSDLLISGRGGDNSFEEVIVNQEFADLLGEKILNRAIVINNSASTNFKTFDEENPFIKDQLNIEKTLKIVGIIKEFPFLNTPKIYYSYYGARDYLKGEIMENLSSYFEVPYSFYDYIVDSKNDDVATSYSRLIFLTSLDESQAFFKKIKLLDNTALEITSSVADIKETYITFISSFSKTLLVFSLIAFVGINLILGMISLSSFLQNRKNAAILTCLGSRNSSIYKIHLLENYIIIAISFWLSLVFSDYLQKFLNPLLSKKFSLSNLIDIPFENFLNIRFGLIIFLAVAVVVISTLFTIIPMVFYRHGYITEELRDE